MEWGRGNLMESERESAFGLCLGSGSATVAAYRDGKTDVLANEFGHRSTPTLVTFVERERLVGQSAQQALHRNASNTASCMTLLLGHQLEDVQEIIKDLPCKVISKDGGLSYQFSLGGKDVSIPIKEPLVEVFKKLKEMAESFDSSSQMKAVIATPANFTEIQKQALSECAISAGFQVLRCISEPAAACLAYAIGQNDRNYSGHVLVFNLGMSTLTLTILQVLGGMYRTVATQTHASLGGKLFNITITELLVSEFQRQWKMDVRGNQRAMFKLQSAAESAKHALSTDQTASIHLESLHEGIDFQYTLTRGRFEGMCTTLFRSYLEPIPSLLGQAGVTKEQLDHVILSGGSCKIPRLQQLLQGEFPSSSLHQSISPDEVIASGCALQAGLLAGRDSSEPPANIIPCTSTELWIACTDGEECFAVQLIPQHTPIPCKRTAILVVKPSDPGQEKVCLEVREGRKTSDRVVAKLFVPVEAAEDDQTVDVTIQWQRDDVIMLSAREPSSNWSCSISLECEDSQDSLQT